VKLTERSVTDLLRAFASPDPTPGGGSGAALAGAVGASLLAMVAGLPKPRTSTDTDAADLAAAGRQCAEASARLAALIDQDSEAYDLVLGAFRMPKATDEEKAARSAAIQRALQAATATPLDVMRACHDAIGHAAVVGAFGNRNASSDALVALELLGAGLRGAKLNVEVNVDSIKDAAFVTKARADAERLTAEAEAGLGTARSRLAGS
jgi:methenyltetrahydrofolate cyclohydrolase